MTRALRDNKVGICKADFILLPSDICSHHCVTVGWILRMTACSKLWQLGTVCYFTMLCTHFEFTCSVKPSWTVSAFGVFSIFISFLCALSWLSTWLKSPKKGLTWLAATTDLTKDRNRTHRLTLSFFFFIFQDHNTLGFQTCRMLMLWGCRLGRPVSSFYLINLIRLSITTEFKDLLSNRSFCFHFDSKSSPTVLSGGCSNSLHAKS